MIKQKGEENIIINKRYHNKEHIIYYEINGISNCTLFTYNKKKNHYQYYSKFLDDNKYSEQDIIDKGLIVIDFKVYYKPCVNLYFSSKVEKKVEFEKVEDGIEYIKNLNLDQSKFI